MVLVGLAGWLVLHRKRSETPPDGVTTFAVLPFTLGASTPEEAHLAAGLGADLHRRLTSIDSLQSIPRRRVPADASLLSDTDGLGRQLGAEILIGGRVNLEPGQVVVRLEIIDLEAPTATHELELGGSREHLFDLQEQLARQVLRALGIKPSLAEEMALRRAPTRSLKAWDYAARGQGYLDQPTNPRGPAFAADLYRRAIQLDPDFALAHIGLSEALWLGSFGAQEPTDLTEAELQARWVLARQPDMTRAVVVLTLIRLARDRAAATGPETLPELDRLSKPDEALREVASGMLRVGKIELAESSLRLAHEMRPQLWLNPYSLGQFLRRSGRFSEAEEAFAQAAAISSPDLSWPQELLLEMRLARGDLAGATDLFETLQADDVDVEVTRQIAAAYRALGRDDAAAIVYRLALDMSPDDPVLHRDIGDLLSRQDQPDAAAEHYRRGLQLIEHDLEDAPADLDRQLDFAGLAARAGDCARALPTAAGLRRHLPPTSSDSLELARVFALCDQQSMAKEALENALRLGLDPDAVRAELVFLTSFSASELVEILERSGGRPPSP